MRGLVLKLGFSFMVVNKGCHGYYVIQSSFKNEIDAYGRKRQKGGKILTSV